MSTIAGATGSRRPAVVLVSGGLDSETCLAIAAAEGFGCYAISFAYGQRHDAELAAAARVAAALGAVQHRAMNNTKQGTSELSYLESFFAPKGYKSNPAQAALATAPVVLVLCADPAQSGRVRGQEYYLTDTGIAAQSLMLAARALGLGTVFVGIFQEETLPDLLGIPEGVRVVGLFPLGYPAEEKKEGPKRKPLHEICFSERWGVPASDQKQ